MNTTVKENHDMEHFEYFNTTEKCRHIQIHASEMTHSEHAYRLEADMRMEKWEGVLAIISIGFLALVTALANSYMRRRVYKDESNVDRVFDAGGNASTAITANHAVAQWTWAATLLQSSTVTVKYGISGALWYAASAAVQVLLFPMLSLQMRIRAPGAKTFLQVINARFGRETHIVFCVFAIATNMIVTSMLMLGGGAVINALVPQMCVDYAIVLVAGVIGIYTMIGGLGATLYFSFFTNVVIYSGVLIVSYNIYQSDRTEFESIGSISKVYDFVSCAKGPEGNQDRSYLTMISNGGLEFGLTGLIGNFAPLFVDNSYWQLSVATRPRQGVKAFLIAGIAWFVIPFTLATSAGMAYIAMSAEQGHHMLTLSEINAGLVLPTVISHVLGKGGSLLVLLMVIMAIISTGSSQVVAMSSIVIYDIYAHHLKPFRLARGANSCILCGKGRGRFARVKDTCTCVSLRYCRHCHDDDKRCNEYRQKKMYKNYTCHTHGRYRMYNDYLKRLKSWVLLSMAVCIIPYTLLLNATEISLSWMYLSMGISVGSSVIPISLSMFWERMTAQGMWAGGIGGTTLSLIVWLSLASTFDGGLANFWENTGRGTVMLTGNIVGILSGGLLSVIFSLVQKIREDQDRMSNTSVRSSAIWENTRDIDNPLSPWSEQYGVELNLADFRHLNNRPTLKEIQTIFKNVTRLAKTVSVSLIVFVIVFLPSVFAIFGVLSAGQFEGLVRLSQTLSVAAAILMITYTLGHEFKKNWMAISNKKYYRENFAYTESLVTSNSDISFAESDYVIRDSKYKSRTTTIRSAALEGSSTSDAKTSEIPKVAPGTPSSGRSDTV